MADNIQLNAGTGGSILMADEVPAASGVFIQRVKPAFGVDGVATDVSASDPLPVVQTGTPALPTGAATAAKQPALGTAGTPSVDVITVQGNASGTPIPVSMSSVPSHAVTNAGTFAVQATSVPTDPFGANADAASATGSISAKLRFIASTGIPVTGTVTVASHAVTNAGTFAVQDSEKVADNAGFTDGTTKVLPAGFIFDEVAGTALTENDAAAARIDSKRAQVFALEDATTRGQRQAVSSGGAAEMHGDVAHDAAASSTNPVLVGARANANEPTAVSADGDAVHLWADLLGRAVVLTGHSNPEPPVSVNATASGANTVIAAPGVGVSLYIQKGSIINGGAADILVELKDGAAGTTRWSGKLAANCGGALFDYGSRGWKLTANTLLSANLGAAGDVRVNVTEYYIAA